MSPPQSPRPPADPQVVNRGATIVQQVNVFGHATLGATTSEVPARGELERCIDNLGHPSLVFQGRDGELVGIRQGLVATGVVAITGLGGMGKTRLALEYALRGKDEYDVRWRIRAGEIASLQDDLVELGRRRGILSQSEDVEHATQEVLAWLKANERWLLVFDNAEDREGLRRMLPSPCPGHVLITSRARAWRGVAEPIEITQLSPAAAKAVLRRRSGQSDDEHADEVARELGYLPLALVQAGAYMEATGCSFRGYLERLAQVGLGMFRDAKAATGDEYEGTVAKTWEISLAVIREQNSAAGALLDWLAFLDPEGVPVRLLREYPEGLPEGLAACVESVVALDEAVAVLLRFSMVDRMVRGEEMLRVHRLVQAVGREMLGAQERHPLASTVVEWVRRVFTYVPDETPLHRVPDGAAEQVMAVSVLDECVEASGHTVASVLNDLGHYTQLRGMLEATRAAYRRCCDIVTAWATARPHDAGVQRSLSVSLNRLGEVEMEAGEIDVARGLLQRSVEVAEGLRNANRHDATALRDLSVALSKLGELEMQAGDLPTARELLKRNQEIAEGLVTASPLSNEAKRDLSVVVSKLGDLEVKAGDLVRARDLFQRHLDEAEALMNAGADSKQAQRDVLVALNKLGSVKLNTGDLTGAHDHFQRFLELAEGLATADPCNAKAAFDVNAAYQWLANVARRQGDRKSEIQHLCTARAVLDAMEAKGQYRGYIALERARHYINIHIMTRVFISYSHDSDAHEGRVLALADELRAGGLDVRLDQYVGHPPEGWPQWTQKQLVDADFVLLVCTPTYCRRFEGEETPGVGRGASWEALIAVRLLYEAGGRNHKLLPVLFEEGTEQNIPLVLRSFTHYRVRADYEGLYRRLTEQPRTPAPPIGEVRPMPPSPRPSLLDHETIDNRGSTAVLATPDPELARLSRALAKGEVVAFVGPGASMAGGLPSWSMLASEARERAARLGVAPGDLRDIDESIASGELADAFTELASRLGGAELTRLISARLDDRHGREGELLEIPEVVVALAELAPWLRAVVTTNLDAFLERAFPREWEVFERPVGDLARRRQYIVHLRGVVRDRGTWVMTRSEHDRVTVADQGYAAYLSAMLRAHPLLFVGFGLDDPDFGRVVERIRAQADGQPVQHVALVREGEITGAQRRKLGEGGVMVIGYEGDAGLVGMLRRLAGTDG